MFSLVLKDLLEIRENNIVSAFSGFVFQTIKLEQNVSTSWSLKDVYQALSGIMGNAASAVIEENVARQ